MYEFQAPENTEQDKLYEAAGISGTRFDPDTDRFFGAFDAIREVARLFGHALHEPVRPLKAHHASALDSVLARGIPLRKYQVEGVKKLLSIVAESAGALLADDMGLGKTRQACVFAYCCVEKFKGRVLIICPAAVREQWGKEISLLFPDENVYVVRPGTTGDITKAQVVICSYEVSEYTIERMGSRVPTVLILDEAHKVKGRKAKRAKKLIELAALATFRLAITGTPLDDRPRDFWQLLNIILGKRIAKSAYEFDVRYCAGKEEQHGFNNKGASNSEELKRRLGYYMVRRSKAEVLTELPPVSRSIRWVDPTDHARRNLETAIVTKRPGSFHTAVAATLDGKIDLAVETAVACEKFVLFTWLRDHARLLGEKIRAEGTNCYVITGDMPAQQRETIVAKAADEGVGVVATIDSVGTGVNMQRIASVGIFHALDYKPMKLMQAEARLHRMGQPNAVTWIYLCMKNSADEIIVNHVVNKLDMWQSAMPNTEGDGSKGLASDFQVQPEVDDIAFLNAAYAKMGDE